MSNGRVETVTIENEKGDPIVINKSDFDEKSHKLYSEVAGGAPELSDLTATELKSACDLKGIAYKGNASKAELIAALEAAGSDE